MEVLHMAWIDENVFAIIDKIGVAIVGGHRPPEETVKVGADFHMLSAFVLRQVKPVKGLVTVSV
jgi:hypothetical protein